MVRRTTQGRINCEIKFKIYSIMFLHPNERYITTISTRLQKVKLAYNKNQNTTTLNWGSA